MNTVRCWRAEEIETVFFPFTELVCSLSCKWKCLKWAGKVKKSTYSIHSTQIYQVSGVVEWLRLQKYSKEPALILALTSQEGRKKRNIPGNDVWHIKTNPTQKEGRCRWDLKGGNLGEERDILVMLRSKGAEPEGREERRGGKGWDQSGTKAKSPWRSLNLILSLIKSLCSVLSKSNMISHIWRG